LGIYESTPRLKPSAKGIRRGHLQKEKPSAKGIRKSLLRKKDNDMITRCTCGIFDF